MRSVSGRFYPDNPEQAIEMAQLKPEDLHFTLHYRQSRETGEVVFTVFMDEKRVKRVFMAGSVKLKSGAGAGMKN